MKDKILQKYDRDGLHLIAFTCASNGNLRAEFAAETQEEWEGWYNALSVAWKNIEKCVKFHEVIGTGQFASVRKAISRGGEYEYAVKIISKSDPERYDRESMLRELRVLEVINHPNIPKIYGVYEDIDRMYIFMENIETGSLFDQLKTKYVLEQEESLRVISDVLKTIRYLEELKIMHRDVKPENILVEKDSQGNITQSFLIDFGLSTFCDYRRDGPEMQMWGTLGYTAPEILFEQGYDHKIDIFSLGVIFFFIATGELPFDGYSDLLTIEMTKKNSMPRKASLFENSHKDLPELIQSMLDKDPCQRITADELMLHPLLLTHFKYLAH